MPPRISRREWLPLVILVALALLGLALVPVIFPSPSSQSSHAASPVSQ